MASKRRGLPEINAGSMADIAFLLLIFFLVTTTMDIDTGIARKLPPMPEEDQPEDDSQINARNIYVVLINSNNQLLVEGEMMDISQLRDGAKSFIDNNGVREDLSENPEKAIISLQNDRGTSYKMYIRVHALVHSISCDKKKIFPCSTYLDGEYGLDPFTFGVPPCKTMLMRKRINNI